MVWFAPVPAAPAAGRRSAPAAGPRSRRPPGPRRAGAPPPSRRWSAPAPAGPTPSPGRARGTPPSARRCARAAAAGRPARPRRAPARPAPSREPGARTASVTPPRSSSSTSTRANAVEGFTRPHRGEPRPPARVGAGVGGHGVEPVGLGPHHGQRAVDREQRRAGDVVGEQGDGGQSARERQLGQRGGQRDAGGDAHRALQRRGHHARQAVRLGDPQRGAHPAQRLHLEDDDVARPRAGRPAAGRPTAAPPRRPRSARRSGGAARPAPPASAHGCSTYSRPTPVELADAGDGGVDVPGGVGVDPDRAGRAQRVAHGLDARQVVGRRLPGLGDLHLGGPAAGRRDDRVRPLRRRRPARSR